MIEGVACETRLLSNDQAEENSHASSKAFCFWLLVTATLAFSPNKSVELSLRADSDSSSPEALRHVLAGRGRFVLT